MKAKQVLLVILVIGTVGLGFSGYLTYRELAIAEEATACAPVGAPGTVLGYPPCLYGLAMYTAIVVVTCLGLQRLRRDARGPAVHVSRDLDLGA